MGTKINIQKRLTLEEYKKRYYELRKRREYQAWLKTDAESLTRMERQIGN